MSGRPSSIFEPGAGQEILVIADGEDALAEARAAVADLARREIFAARQVEMVAKQKPQPLAHRHLAFAIRGRISTAIGRGAQGLNVAV